MTLPRSWSSTLNSPASSAAACAAFAPGLCAKAWILSCACAIGSGAARAAAPGRRPAGHACQSAVLRIDRRARPDRSQRKLRHLDLLAGPVGVARPRPAALGADQRRAGEQAAAPMPSRYAAIIPALRRACDQTARRVVGDDRAGGEQDGRRAGNHRERQPVHFAHTARSGSVRPHR